MTDEGGGAHEGEGGRAIRFIGARRFAGSAVKGHAYAAPLNRDLDSALFDICAKQE